MKKQLQFLTVSFLLLAFSFSTNAQTTRRVNGDPNITGVNVYNTIQAAVDAASNDDVILIEPYGTPTGYLQTNYTGSVVVSKKLHFRGNGYYLSNPQLPFTPLDNRYVYVSSITFDIGSAESTVKNLYVNSTNIYVPNVLLQNSRAGIIYLNSFEVNNVTVSAGINTVVRQCLTSQIDDNRSSSNQSNQNLNLLVENSVIAHEFIDCDNSIIKNCHITRIKDVSGSSFTNCVITQSLANNNNGVNSFFNSICFANSLPLQSNNTNGATYQQVYSGSQYYNDNTYTGENDLELSASSIAKNAGINGGDIGVYGGTYPYEKSGLPHHPISTFFINSGIGNNAIDVDVVITIKAN